MRMHQRWLAILGVAVAWTALSCLPERKDTSAASQQQSDTGNQDASADSASAPCGDGKLQGSEQCDSAGANWCTGCDKCQVRNTWKVSGESDLASGSAKDGLAKVWTQSATGFSVEFWFKPQALPAANESSAMFAVWGIPANSPAMVVALARDQAKGAVYVTCAYLPKQSDPSSGTFLQGGDQIKVGVWHHARCAWVAADKVMRFSQDGEPTVSSPKIINPPAQLFDSLSWLMIGHISLDQAKTGFLGELDELRLLSGAASNTFNDFQARYDQPTSDTELLLHMDQATGAPRLSDSSDRQLDLKQTVKGQAVFKFEQAPLSFLPETCYGFTEAQVKCKVAAMPKPAFCK